jgi:predicted membrane protein
MLRGDVNFSKYKPFRSRAEERIAAINVYVGPITKVLWGVELTLSWVFVFAFVVWILLIELIIVPVSSIFDWEIWWSLLGSAIIATLAMQGFGKDLVVWMNSLMTQWWVGFVVLFFAVVVGILYSVFFKFVKKYADKTREKDKKDRTARDRKILSVEAKLIKDSLRG